VQVWAAAHPLWHPTGGPGGLVAAVEDLGGLVDPLGPRGSVARGGAQVDVPEPGEIGDQARGVESAAVGAGKLRGVVDAEGTAPAGRLTTL